MYSLESCTGVQDTSIAVVMFDSDTYRFCHLPPLYFERRLQCMADLNRDREFSLCCISLSILRLSFCRYNHVFLFFPSSGFDGLQGLDGAGIADHGQLPLLRHADAPVVL